MTEQPNPYSQPESSELPIVEAKTPTSKRRLWFWLVASPLSVAFFGIALYVGPLALIGLATVWVIYRFFASGLYKE